MPELAAGPALDQAEQARQVCQRCPAREPCLRWALDRGVAFGIWGGATEDERPDDILVLVEEVAQGGADQVGCFLGQEVTGGQRGTADVGGVLLPDAERLVGASDEGLRAP